MRAAIAWPLLQILIWGQSCVALLVGALFRVGNPAVSPYLGALVTLGMETGMYTIALSNLFNMST
jgi:hypothetical protein